MERIVYQHCAILCDNTIPGMIYVEVVEEV